MNFDKFIQAIDDVQAGKLIGTGGVSVYAIPQNLVNAESFTLQLDFANFPGEEPRKNTWWDESTKTAKTIVSVPVAFKATNDDGAFVHNLNFITFCQLLADPTTLLKVALNPDKKGKTDRNGQVVIYKNITAVKPTIANDELFAAAKKALKIAAKKVQSLEVVDADAE